MQDCMLCPRADLQAYHPATIPQVEHSISITVSLHFSICNSYFPQFKYKNPYLISPPSVFLFPCVLIWPFWKDISTDVHSLDNKADHPPPLPHRTNNKPAVTGMLYSFTLCIMLKTQCFEGKKTRVLHLPELLDLCYRLCGNCLWLSYLMASCLWRSVSDATLVLYLICNLLLTPTNI